MLAQPSCEICGHSDWQILGRRTYNESEAEKYPPYTQKRFSVLFDKWLPGRTSITLTSNLCRKCGFIIYMPRPERRDIDSKYKHLEALGQDYGQATPYDSAGEIKRSDNLVRYLGGNIDLPKVNRILDYGGADGRLMQSFSKLGKSCYLIDYNRNCIPGVRKLSDTIEALDSTETFDLIICSHVIEHVAEPLRVLNLLISHLAEHGNIFIEVPLEVWKSPPLQQEPVTHINFFTPNSLSNLMLMAGLIVKRCEVAAWPHQSGTRQHGIRAVGSKAGDRGANSVTELLTPDAMNFLKPNLLQTVRYHLAAPQRIPKLLLRKLSHRAT